MLGMSGDMILETTTVQDPTAVGTSAIRGNKIQTIAELLHRKKGTVI